MGAPRSLAVCHYYLGTMAYFRGQFETALEHLARAQALYRQVGARFGEAVALQVTGLTETALGRLDVGRALFERALEMVADAPMASHARVRLYASLVRNRLDANDMGAAIAAAEEGLALVDEHHCICNAGIYPAAAVVAALNGDAARAEDLTRRAVARAEELRSPMMLCGAQQARALERAAVGDWPAAFEAVELARREAIRGGLVYELGRVLLLGVYVHLDGPGPLSKAEALGLMRQAVRIFARLGVRAATAQARSSLGMLRDRLQRQQPKRHTG
jgi:tetratricopeptide (TPR) repeat protein